MAAQNCYWTGGTAGVTTDFHTATNWGTTSGDDDGRVPTAEDAVIFDSGGNGYDCTATAAMVCNTFTAAASSWTKNFSMGGFTLTIGGTFTIASAGTWTLNANITQTGNGDFSIASTCGSTNGSSCNLDLKGTGGLIIDKAMATVEFTSMKLAYPEKVTTSTGAGQGYYWTRKLYINGGTLTITTNHFLGAVYDSTPLNIVAGSVINGDKTLSWYTRASSNLTVELPGINYTGTGGFYYYKISAYDDVLNMNGNLYFPTGSFSISGGLGTFIINTNNYSLTALAGRPSMDFSNYSTGTTTVNYGSSACSATIPDWHCFGGHLYLNFQSSTWTDVIEWLFTFTAGEAHVDVGTSTVTTATVGAQIQCSNGGKFNTLIAALGASAGLSFKDNFYCNNLTVTGNEGTITQSGKVFNIAGNLSIQSWSITLNNTINMTGNGTFEVVQLPYPLGPAYIGAKDFASCVLNLQGNTTITVTLIEGVATFSRLILAAGKTYTFTNTDKIAITNFTAGDWSGTAGNRVKWVSSSPTSAYQITAPASVIMKYVDITDCNNIGTSINVNTDYVNGGNNTGFIWASLSSLLIIPQIKRIFSQSMFRKRLLGGI